MTLVVETRIILQEVLGRSSCLLSFNSIRTAYKSKNWVGNIPIEQGKPTRSQKLKGDTQMDRHQGDIISLLSLIQNEECGLKVDLKGTGWHDIGLDSSG
jgi:hypothetical protein